MARPEVVVAHVVMSHTACACQGAAARVTTRTSACRSCRQSMKQFYLLLDGIWRAQQVARMILWWVVQAMLSKFVVDRNDDVLAWVLQVCG